MKSVCKIYRIKIPGGGISRLAPTLLGETEEGALVEAGKGEEAAEEFEMARMVAEPA